MFVPGVGVVRNRATDPYAVSLSADSKRTLIADLDDPTLKPDGWDATPRPAPLAAQVDMGIYELHVRDFSRDDASVPAQHRGKSLAFTQRDSNGMRHLLTVLRVESFGTLGRVRVWRVKKHASKAVPKSNRWAADP